MTPIPFIADSDPRRTRTAVTAHVARGYTPPRCPWCRHWQPIGWLWTCNAGHQAGERTVECAGFERLNEQIDMFEAAA